MRIHVYPVVSSLHQKEGINQETSNLIAQLSDNLDIEIKIVELDKLYIADLSLILIQSGGSEQEFLKILPQLKQPIYLLTYGSNNSLAASMEILSYLKGKQMKGEILHGDIAYLSNRIRQILDNQTIKLGVIGKPSDWLIASDVSYKEALQIHHIELIDISIEEFIQNYRSQEDIKNNLTDYPSFNQVELNKAMNVYHALKKIIKKYDLKGITVRCFSLLDTIHTTSCLAFAMLNQEGIIATCEGDIPTLITMLTLQKVTQQIGFQANPSKIDLVSQKMILAHCTIPLNMLIRYQFDTHYESKIGVAIKGELKQDRITIFKIGNDLKSYYVNTGNILQNLTKDNLCRTQIEITLDNNMDYFLNYPLGNHHVIVYGDYKKELEAYMNQLIKE